MTRRFLAYTMFVTLVLLGSRVARAEDDEGRGEKLFTSDLVRVVELAPALPAALFSAPGSDPLREGETEVRRKREVAVKVRGALASGAYGVWFCPFGQPQTACPALGSLSTDSEGNGEARLPFPAAGGTWAGAILLTRDAKNQFISGFRFPPDAEAQQLGAEVELKGRITSLNLLNNSFRIEGLAVDIVVGTSTRFKKISFTELFVGLTVEVEGFTRPDGTIFAVEVKAEED